MSVRASWRIRKTLYSTYSTCTRTACTTHDGTWGRNAIGSSASLRSSAQALPALPGLACARDAENVRQKKIGLGSKIKFTLCALRASRVLHVGNTGYVWECHRTASNQDPLHSTRIHATPRHASMMQMFSDASDKRLWLIPRVWRL